MFNMLFLICILLLILICSYKPALCRQFLPSHRTQQCDTDCIWDIHSALICIYHDSNLGPMLAPWNLLSGYGSRLGASCCDQVPIYFADILQGYFTGTGPIVGCPCASDVTLNNMGKYIARISEYCEAMNTSSNQLDEHEDAYTQQSIFSLLHLCHSELKYVIWLNQSQWSFGLCHAILIWY